MLLKFKFSISITILVIIIGVVFGDLTQSFYEQEEWLGLGNVFVLGSDYVFSIFNKGFIRVITGEGRILSSLITYFFYNTFPLNTLPITLFALSLHLINSFLVFLLCFAILKKVVPSLVGAAFFVANAVSHSAVTWSAAVSTLPATTLILLTLFTFLKSIDFFENENNQKNSKKWITMTFLLLYVSMLFKQVGILLFPLLLLAGKVLKGNKFSIKNFFTTKSKVYQALGLLLILLIVAIVGVYMRQFKFQTTPNALFLTGSSPYFYETLVTRAVLYPLTSFSLIFVPPVYFSKFARYITDLYYPFFSEQQFVLIAQTVVLDLLAVILTVVILGTLYKLSKSAESSKKRMLWFFVVFILLTFLPYTIIAKSYAYLDSRYYYLASVGASFVVAWVLDRISSSKYLYIVGIILTIFYIWAHADSVKRDIEKQSAVSTERKDFLLQLKKIKPVLENNKNIFLVTGSDNFYLPGHKVPFQNGMGHSLSVWYYQSGKIPKELVRSGDLFELGKQGYFEYEEKGFGYFSDKESLKQAIIDDKLSDYSIIYLYYDANSKRLLDKTSEISEMYY